MSAVAGTAAGTTPALTTLVTGSSTASREQGIAAVLDAQLSTAVLLEGMASGSDHFAALAGPHLQIVRIAPGCMCCTGNLTMRVTLNRLLRQRPARLYISLATGEHLDNIRALLSQPPYTDWLTLTAPLACP